MSPKRGGFIDLQEVVSIAFVLVGALSFVVYLKFDAHIDSWGLTVALIGVCLIVVLYFGGMFTLLLSGSLLSIAALLGGAALLWSKGASLFGSAAPKMIDQTKKVERWEFPQATLTPSKTLTRKERDS